MTRVLVLTGGRIGEHMSGPAIRAWNIARVLSLDHTVTLATTGELDAQSAPFDQVSLVDGDERGFRRLEAQADVIIFQGLANRQFRSLRRSTRILVADLYAPMHLEQLELTHSLSEDHSAREIASATWLVDEQLIVADFVLCASLPQRHLYLGHLAALGRITPSRYRGDPALERLIAVVPFGLEDTTPVHDRAAIRGVIRGIGPDDKLLVWAGGIYEWFDPETLIAAVGLLSIRRPDLRLVFIGTHAPGTIEMPIVERSRRLAEGLGLLDRSVFFNEGWVAWDDRHNYLLEADAGVSTHRAHLETEFSFRTRVLDYLWAGLPMVVTAGDMFADLAERRGLGAVVEPQDPAALAEAIERVVYDPNGSLSLRNNVLATRSAFAWERVLEPLRAFVAHPQPAPDRLRGRGRLLRIATRTLRPESRSRVARYSQRASGVLDREGAGGLVRRLLRLITSLRSDR